MTKDETVHYHPVATVVRVVRDIQSPTRPSRRKMNKLLRHTGTFRFFFHQESHFEYIWANQSNIKWCLAKQKHAIIPTKARIQKQRYRKHVVPATQVALRHHEHWCSNKQHMTSEKDPNEYKLKGKVCELHGYSMAARQRAPIRGPTRQRVKRMGCKTRSKIITNQSHSTISGLFIYFMRSLFM